MRSTFSAIRMALLACLVVLASLLGSSQLRADWSTYLNGPGRLASTSENLPEALTLKWVYHSPAAPEMAWEGPRSQPIEGKVMRHRVAFDKALQVAVAGDKLFFGSSVDHQVHCVEAASGKSIWTFFTDGAVRLAPTVWQGNVYFGSDDGFVYCVRGQDGELIWKHRVGPTDERLLARGRMISRWPVRTGVLVDQGIAYFGGGVIPHETVFLCAVEAKSGKPIWKNDQISHEDAGRNPLSPQGYLLCSDEYLFVPSGRSLPAAFDRKTGRQVHHKTYSWRSTAGGVVGGSRALLADGQIYASGAHHFLALDQATGAVGHAFIAGHQLAIQGDKAFVADGNRVAGLDRDGHAEATVKRQKLAMQRSSLLRKRSSMKAAEFREQERELSSQMNALSQVGSLWECKTPADSALIVAGETVVAGGSGQVVGIRYGDGERLWSLKVDGEAAGLAASGGRLYVSTDEGKIYCFASDEAEPQVAEALSHPGELIKNPYPNDDKSELYAAAAESILQQSDVRRGFCLVIGARDGRLACELARRSDLRVYGIEADPKRVETARRKLQEAGLYGNRVTIVQGKPGASPFSNYFANLIVSDSFLHDGTMPGDAHEWLRCLKPCGGKICLVLPTGAPIKPAKALADVEKIVDASNVNFQDEASIEKGVLMATRGKLPGAGDWSHQYGDVGNTASSSDYRVKGGLGVLWYGDPGPSKMINRHEAAAAPLSTNGRMFIQGTNSILAYDAYNGLFLWEHANPGAIRTGVFNNEETSNLAASDDALFVAVGDTCTVLDAATGKIRTKYRTPPSPDKIPRVWGFIAHWNGMLLGTSTVRKELADSLRRRGHTVDNLTDSIFAIDLESGEQKWLYRGKNILHVTIAVGDDRVFFIDSSLTREQRNELLRQDKTELKKLGPEEAKKKEAELKALDIRLAVCVDAHTGKQLWSRAVDVTDCSRVGIGGGNLTLMYRDGHVVICGANANGHYWRQFLSGQFDRRRLVVLDSEKGELLWSKDANYRHRPIIVGQEIFAEPWAFDLRTGAEKMREHPLTGEPTKWQFSRPGHHCGMATATPNMLFFRSGYTGYYDLYSDSGTSHFAGQRLGCWVNAIPGNGLLMIPEASAGCVCQFSLAATIVMEPRQDRDTWKIYSTTGASKPVKHLAVNLGAPGDRRDQQGTLWLAYPRPKTVGRLEYVFDIKPKFDGKPDYSSFNSLSHPVGEVETPWLYTSLANGLTQCRIPLVDKKEEEADYTVELHFAEWDHGVQPGDRLFDVRIQGETALESLDVLKSAGGLGQALVRKVEGVRVDGDLVIELAASPDAKNSSTKPILAAIRVQRQD